MPERQHSKWQAGQRVIVRDAVWSILERSEYTDCELLRLRAEHDLVPACRTILLPFDRPRAIPAGGAVRVMRPASWLKTVAALAAEARPFGGLSTAAGSGISIFGYQLEPALLMQRDGVARVVIADAVGLGKTIQAGLVLSELTADHQDFRALVIVPAGLREQWSGELSTHFHLDAIAADTRWLARAASEIPPDVNPWELPGIYIASCDFIKRPEVLRPLEDLTWDAVVVDEAHQVALGTARRAAVHAIACRARRVVLLTATPHTGDPDRFAALCNLGAHDSSSPRIVLFRRERVGADPGGARRTHLLQVHPTAEERRMHRLLEAYTDRLWQEGHARDDPQPRLIAIVLRKRALSSAASVAASCRRRLALLHDPDEHLNAAQLALPFGEEDPLEDAEPDAVLGAPGLNDCALERQMLTAVAVTAEKAGTAESKVRFLRRLLSRIEEPAIVFTEYRDTLERLRRALSGIRRDIEVLHGGMNFGERAASQRAFNSRSSLLIATDAASEGLNLHSRCRLVIHFELPWTPARLEQRAGRVDRIGQARRAHEILLVANDTAERLVLAPLVARSVRSRRAVPGESSLLERLTESSIASAVMQGVEVPVRSAASMPVDYQDPPVGLSDEAIAEAQRIIRYRQQRASSARKSRSDDLLATTVPKCRRLPAGMFVVYEITLRGPDGAAVHRDYGAARLHTETALDDPRAAVRSAIARFRGSAEARVREQIRQRFASRLAGIQSRWLDASAALIQREEAIVRSLPSAAVQLVQAGLFDQRAIRASAARTRASSAVLQEARRRIDALGAAPDLTLSLNLSAVLVSGGGRR